MVSTAMDSASVLPQHRPNYQANPHPCLLSVLVKRPTASSYTTTTFLFITFLLIWGRKHACYGLLGSWFQSHYLRRCVYPILVV